MTQVAIIGAGAIGSAVGALLSRAGCEVTLIARKAQVEAIRQHGLRVDGRLGTFNAQVNAEEKLSFRPDYALLTVKTQDVVAALEANRSSLGDAPLVTMQNGVQSDDLAATLVPRVRIVSAVVSVSATHLTPGTVTIVYPGTLVIGHPYAESLVPLEPLQRVLQAAVPTRISQNIRGVHWLKLLFNLNNAFPALLDSSLHHVYRYPYMRSLAARVIREGLRVVDGAGIRLESLPEVSVGLFRALGILPPPLAGLLILARAHRIESEWPLLGSTLQSLRRGQRTEIDFLNGEIVRVGAAHGVRVPLNERLVELVHEVERTGKFFSVHELRERVESPRS